MNADVKTRFQLREKGKPLALDRQVGIVRFSPCGKVLAAGDFEGQVRRWDATAQPYAPLPHLTGHHGWVQGLAFAPEGGTLFTADSWGRLCAWPYTEKTPRPVWALDQAHEGWIRKLAVHPDGKTLASCGADGRVRLWSVKKGEKVREWTAGLDVLSLAFHPDGQSLVFGDLRGTIRQHDLTSGKLVRTYDASAMYRLDRIQDVGGVRVLAFDPTGKSLAAAGCQPTSGGFVQGSALVIYFDAVSGNARQTLKYGGNNEGYVHDLTWHAEGFLLAVTSGQPGQGKLFCHRPGDAAPFFVTARMPNCHSLAVHPDGRRLVVAATNANSSGNGRLLTKEKSYPGNHSPLWTWELPG